MNNEIYKQLTDLAFKKSKPFCYQCYKIALTGVCTTCQSDDLMRLVDGVGCEYGTEWIVKHILETELQEPDLEECFENHVRECFPNEVTICWREFDQATVLKELDPISWNCSYLEWLDQEVESGNLVSFDNGSRHYSIKDVQNLLDG